MRMVEDGFLFSRGMMCLLRIDANVGGLCVYETVMWRVHYVHDGCLVAPHCNTLQSKPATPCNTLQHTAPHCTTLLHSAPPWLHNTAARFSLYHAAPRCTTLLHTATRRNHTVVRCNTLQHTATYCNTLQHTATHCNTLQHDATTRWYTATHCSTPQYTAKHFTTLQHTAAHCSTLQYHDDCMNASCHQDAWVMWFQQLEIGPYVLEWHDAHIGNDCSNDMTHKYFLRGLLDMTRFLFARMTSCKATRLFCMK